MVKKLRILTVVEGAVFALLGLLIAFSFDGAYDRFQARKMRIIEEASAFATAYDRISLLAPETQPELRATFTEFLDTEIQIFEHISFIYSDKADIRQLLQLRDKLWKQSITATNKTANLASTMLFIPAVTNLFDSATTHIAINRIHPPFAIMGLLILLAIISAFLAGYGTAGSAAYNKIYIITYAIITALTIYIIIDLEFPRLGLIRVNSFDSVLFDLRDTLSTKK